MNDLNLVKTLEKARLTIFTTQQLSIILGNDVPSTSVRLTRLVKKGVLMRIIQGRYALPSSDVFLLASNIYSPSYVSLYSAFEYYGTTTQSPRIIDVINTTTSKKLTISVEMGKFDVRFIKTDPLMMFGYKKFNLNGKEMTIAEKEKAIIDGLLFSEYVPLDEVFSCIKSGIDHKKLIRYAKKTNHQTVLKRLGYLLSQAGIPYPPEQFPVLSATYVPLDPRLPRCGHYDKKWRVIINSVIE